MATRTSRRRAGNLPADVTSFVGRRQEISRARQLLSSTRLLTLTGPGGVGKTRLARQVASEVSRAFPDGVWLVELAPLRDAALVSWTISSALGLQDQSARPAVASLAEYLSDKRLLLVLDNCEHLVPACANVLGEILSAAPGLHVLATSRQALGCEGEWVLTVPPLSGPEPDAPSPDTSAAHWESVELFAARAAAAVPGFTLTPVTQEAVTRLCGRLDGIPLAIELAAVNLRFLSVHDLAERLDDRFSLLTVASDSDGRRHRSLQAAMDWSHDLCSPEERLLWARLSVFRGGFDLESAEHVCSGEEIVRAGVLDTLVGLVDKSIVNLQDAGAAGRYRMLETVREYGGEQLVRSGAHRLMRERHRDWYMKLVERARDDWFTGKQSSWFVRLGSELANLRSALEFSLSRPDEVPQGLELAARICNYWMRLGMSEGRHWMDRALSVADGPDERVLNVLWIDAWAAGIQGDLQGAVELTERCRVMAEQLDSPNPAVPMVRGITAFYAGDPERASALLGEALEGFRSAGDATFTWVALFYVALVASFTGSADAGRLTAECLSTAGDAQWCQSHALWISAMNRWREGEPEEAVAMARDGLRQKASVGDLWGIANCIELLAWVHDAMGQHRYAAGLLGSAQTFWRATGTSVRGGAARGARHDACETRLREQLGDGAFLKAFERGAGLGQEQSVVYALGETTAQPASEEIRDDSQLTSRQREVAQLLAEGLTNKEIAERLVIAQRTAEAHVENILTRLGFSSRAQIAAWSVEHRAH